MQDSPINSDSKLNDESEKPPQENLQERLEQLQTSFDHISAQLITVKENIQKRKRETATLKILLYTGLFLLLIGFIYSNTTLQRIQLQNLQSDFQVLIHQTNQDLKAIQGSVLNEIQRMKNRMERTALEKRNAKTLREALVGVKQAIAKIKPADAKTKELTERFVKNSNNLLLSYANYKKSLSSPSHKNPKK